MDETKSDIDSIQSVHPVVPSVTGRIKRQIAWLGGILVLMGLSFADIFGWLKEHPETWKFVLGAFILDVIYLIGQFYLDSKREKHASELTTLLVEKAASRTQNSVTLIPPSTALPSSEESSNVHTGI